MLLGLGWPEWLVIVGLVSGIFLTFWLMAKGSMAYERSRRRRRASHTARGSTGDEA